VDRNLAAINPKAADNYAADKVAESVLKEPAPIKDEPLDGRTPARRAFLGVAADIYLSSKREGAERDAKAKELWG
jgi:hypothetical protein